jgi:hypothetical protein
MAASRVEPCRTIRWGGLHYLHSYHQLKRLVQYLRTPETDYQQKGLHTSCRSEVTNRTLAGLVEWAFNKEAYRCYPKGADLAGRCQSIDVSTRNSQAVSQ